MDRRLSAYTFLFAIASMLAGLFCVSVTVAGNDYTNVLRWGLAFSLVSVLSFAMVFIRGSWRWRIAVPIAAIPLAYVVLMVGLRLPFESRLTRVQSHLASHRASLAQAVADLTSTNEPGSRISSASLPPALAAPGVRLVICGESNVSLILNHNPDTMSGLRIWIGEPAPDYSDRATELPEVFRYSYCNDLPISSSNRPY